jgi:hypothetical protein
VLRSDEPRPGEGGEVWLAAVRWSVRGLTLVALLLVMTGLLPHLVLTQALLIGFVFVVAGPLWNIGRNPPRWFTVPIPACLAVSVVGVTLQLPPVAAVVGTRGLVAMVALSVLLVASIAFWSVVNAPAPRLSGALGAGYVVLGGVPISMPGLILMVAPRDIYSAFHAAGASLLAPTADQQLAGFALLGVVKLGVLIAFTVIFIGAYREAPDYAGGGGQGPGRDETPPDLPRWAAGLGPQSPAVEEPTPVPASQPLAPVS